MDGSNNQRFKAKRSFFPFPLYHSSPCLKEDVVESGGKNILEGFLGGRNRTKSDTLVVCI